MALSITQTQALAGILKPGMRVASMGYPDLIAPIADLPGLEYRDDSEAICRRHGLQARKIPDAESYFSLRGCELDVYDIVKERGCEHLADLNYPWASLEEGGNQQKYDVVLDVGTLEHCFNIAQAAITMASLIKSGGVILHENPFNWGNHGFYGLNPTWYADFYNDTNGFTLIDCRLIPRTGEPVMPPQTSRFVFNGQEANIFAMARRESIGQLRYPTQTKYRNLIGEPNG